MPSNLLQAVFQLKKGASKHLFEARFHANILDLEHLHETLRYFKLKPISALKQIIPLRN
jgi:hypothetical protein